MCVGQDGLPDAEGEKAQDLPNDQRREREYQCVGGKDRAALRHGSERRPDQAGSVFGRDQQNAEGADRNLRKIDAVEASQGRIKPLAFDRIIGAEDVEPACTDHGTQGRGLREQPTALSSRSIGLIAASSIPNEGRCESRSLPVVLAGRSWRSSQATRSARYSTLSRVNSMNAASSEAC